MTSLRFWAPVFRHFVVIIFRRIPNVLQNWSFCTRGVKYCAKYLYISDKWLYKIGRLYGQRSCYRSARRWSGRPGPFWPAGPCPKNVQNFLLRNFNNPNNSGRRGWDGQYLALSQNSGPKLPPRWRPGLCPHLGTQSIFLVYSHGHFGICIWQTLKVSFVIEHNHFLPMQYKL